MHALTDKPELVMYRKVKDLSDLDICQLLADIEGLQTYIQLGSVRVNVPDGDDYYFNPLSDNDQLIALMQKHNVERTWEPYDLIGWSYHVVGGVNPIHITERQDFAGDNAPDITMQKAVSLAIILNKSNAFKLV